ncbi:Coenzyme F420 hydrogenase/dehydrogenase, beta subunit C-terminal domain [Microbacterium sp. ARD32]|nr:Coenzyme F420 hydrogenase/dehydrogenase, beta subunit C-terminal domain [Microbacterium sp. ARD32]
MRLDDRGYLRPQVEGESRPVPDAVRIFERSCPGVTVSAPSVSRSSTPHRLLGRYEGIWRAHATDPEVRRAGSSGGVLTALHQWLLSQDRAARITGAAAAEKEPRRTVPVTIMTRDQALAAAGSRYAPVAALDNADVLNPGSAVCGKPCEISALRNAAPDLVDGEAPLMLSFFCAGTPSQHATSTLLNELGVPDDQPVDAMRYRGDGWPGRFFVRSGKHAASTDYEESWGRVLGPTTQWRCKVCPDGVGESADIVCADSWRTDERGYPVFSEGDGMSALIARTPRGLQAIRDAEAAGIISLSPLPIRELAGAQPLQVSRRRYLFARLLGSRLAGRRPPRFRGFGLLRLAVRHPLKAARIGRGTFQRVRSTRSR